MKWIKHLLKKTKKRRGREKPFVSAVIVAGGRSTRMGGLDKMKAILNGKSCLARTVEAFQNSPLVSEIVIVAREDLRKEAYQACEGCGKVSRVVKGGEDRTHSAFFGVAAASKDSDIVLIHDGARPLVSEAVIERVIRGVQEHQAAIPAVPVTDTIKTSDGGYVGSTPDRSTLFAVQTPQGFRYELIYSALRDAVDRGLSLTDDSAAVERLGMRVFMVEGDAGNRKLTTAIDIAIAEAILKQTEGERT